jgi:putative SOS response-associated peptidase YedK
MCNVYSLTKGQAAIVALVCAMRDRTGNLPPMPGIFPDFLAPIVRNAPDGIRELATARWACRASRDAAMRSSLVLCRPGI